MQLNTSGNLRKPALALGLALLGSHTNALAGEWYVGLGGEISSSPFIGIDNESAAIPVVVYEGERFSLGIDDISYRLVGDDESALHLVVSGRGPAYDPDDSNRLAGIKERDDAIELGLSATMSFDWGIFGASFLADVSDTHKGFETTLSYSVPFEAGEWEIVPSLGITHQSKKLVDYYYGVRASEATAQRAAYTGRATNSSSFSIEATRELTKQWSLVTGIGYERPGDGMRDSSIVDEKSVSFFYLAGLYQF